MCPLTGFRPSRRASASSLADVLLNVLECLTTRFAQMLIPMAVPVAEESIDQSGPEEGSRLRELPASLGRYRSD